MNILVTGGAGFIGSNLIKELLKYDHDVTAVDNFSNYYKVQYKYENIKDINSKHFRLLNADINEQIHLRRVLRDYHFDKIVHLAACVGVRNSLKKPALYLKTNISGTLNILELAKDFGVKDIIFASSSSVYGDSTPAPFREECLCAEPLNPYAMSKKAGELLCYTYHNLYGLNVTILRFFTVYGPGGRPDMSPYIFTESLLTGKQIKIYGDGSATRDFTNINDITNGIISSINKSFAYEIINLGSSGPISIRKFIGVLEKITGIRANIQYCNQIAGESQNTYADVTKSKKMLNFQPSISLEKGLAEFVDWFKDNRMKG